MTLRLKFFQTSKKFGQECQNSTQNPVLIEYISFSQKVSFTSKTCPGHPACSFDDPRENFLPLFRNLFARSPRTIELFLFPRKFFFSERYSVQMECRFEKPSGNSQPKLSKFSSQNSRKTGKNVSRKKYLFFSKRSSGHLKCRSDKSSGNFTKTNPSIFWSKPKKRRN